MLKRIFMAAFGLTAVAWLPAGAVTQSGPRTVSYVVGYQHAIRPPGVPFTGEMRLTFNNGIVSGRYTDTSIRPGGPLANVRNAAVQGGVDEDHGRIHFTIATRFRVSGTFEHGIIDGNANVRNVIYNFHARPTTPPPEK
jgi:hypothetical protein